MAEMIELTKFDGSNFDLWQFGVTFALAAKELIGFVDGSEAEPDTTEAKNKWRTRSSQAVMILLSSIDKSLHRLLINCRSPKEMWDKLKSLYGETSIDATQSAWQQFYTFNIDDSESIARQIERLETILKKLAASKDQPSEMAVVSKLLSSLPSKFSTFCMAWECTPAAERTKNNLISRILREDKRLATAEKDTEMLAFQVSSLKLHKEKVSRSKSEKIEHAKKNSQCAYCKRKGHWYRECPRSREAGDSGSEESISDAALICEVSAFYSTTSDKDANVWIADTGASNHVTFRRDFFKTLEPLQEQCGVQIADDEMLPAEGIGTVLISAKVCGKTVQRELPGVLYVPKLKRNLFSIGTLMKKKFSFHAYEKTCELRDRDGKLSLTGMRHGSLYRMCFEVKPIAEAEVAQQRRHERDRSRGKAAERYGISAAYIAETVPLIYNEVSPVVQVDKTDLEIAQVEVKTPFLYEDLQEEITLQQQRGYNEKRNFVGKLHRSFCRLKQSPCYWDAEFVCFTRNFKFKSVHSGKCAFVSMIAENIRVLYVYDKMLASKCKNVFLLYLEINLPIAYGDMSELGVARMYECTKIYEVSGSVEYSANMYLTLYNSYICSHGVFVCLRHTWKTTVDQWTAIFPGLPRFLRFFISAHIWALRGRLSAVYCPLGPAYYASVDA